MRDKKINKNHHSTLKKDDNTLKVTSYKIRNLPYRLSENKIVLCKRAIIKMRITCFILRLG